MGQNPAAGIGDCLYRLVGQNRESDSDPQLSKAARLIQQGDLTEATAILQRLVRSRPDDVDALVMLGTALSLVPRRSEAVERCCSQLR